MTTLKQPQKFVEFLQKCDLQNKNLFKMVPLVNSNYLTANDYELLSLRCKITSKNQSFLENEVCILDLKSLMQVFSLFKDEVEVEDAIEELRFKDEKTEVAYTLTDKQVILNDKGEKFFLVPKKEKLENKEWFATLDLNKEFVEKFDKMTDYQGESIFYFVNKYSKFYIGIGSEEDRSNKVFVNVEEYKVGEEPVVVTGKVKFLVSYLKSILKVTKGMKIQLRVSYDLAWLHAEDDDFECEYYFGTSDN